jgi:arsenate reductase
MQHQDETANMRRFYHLANCSTCRRILEDCGLQVKGFGLHDIRSEGISPEQLDDMKRMAGSYESLFSRRAVKYKTMGLKGKVLGESDYRMLILEDDTFLKRPVVVLGDRIFVGSEKATIEALKEATSAL